MVFDECHKAKNVNLKNPKAASKTATNVIAIQARLPRARIVYVSATGASELEHLGYMSRLGLWGAGTAFSSNAEFTTSVASKGTGAMELVAMDLKARGLFLARTLSYRGAEFTIEYVPVSDLYKKLYDATTAIWFEIGEQVERAKAAGTAERSVSTQYWGAHQRFYREVSLQACDRAPEPAAHECASAE